jgi:hypothetical protein
VSVDRGYDGGGCRCDAAEVAKEVQRGALGGQHAARRAADGGDQVAQSYRTAVGPLDLHLDCRIDQSEGEDGKIQAGDDSGLAGDEQRRGPRIRRHDRIRRDVAGAAEIFQQGRADERLDHDRRQRGRVRCV